MISVYKLKPKFQQLLKPLLVSLHKAHVSANQITVASIFLSLIMGILFWFADSNHIFFLALPIGLFLRMALNALDGMMARTYHQQSKLGEIINELGDVLSDLFIYFPLLKFEASALYVVAAFLCLSVTNEFSGALAKIVSGQRRYDGPMGKSDRAFLIGVYGLLCFFNVDISNYAYVIFLILNFLLLASTYLRVKRALPHG
jgi:CDP-diacylglycerol---glycerol-3-phosphate 3-phosphatidyltransferase